jgi:hypothetical protein
MAFFATQCPWWLAGLILGAIVTGLQWTANLPLGATGAFVATADFAGAPSKGASWRVFLFIGIVAGALLHTAITTGFHATWSNGGMDTRFAWAPLRAGVLLVAGLLMGYGARTAGGCTSGHGICGMARASTGSLVSTMVFMAVAVAAASAAARVL